MAELDPEIVIAIQDSDILEVIEDADALLARLVADGELLTGGVGPAKTRSRPRPRARSSRRGKR